ncbi:MAG: prolyl oligopeptidase family serine peptidase [Prevotellaceae bacterium]|jgi:dipeptidyl aminopeptidase/acylaminoacyl peptidase|nr:prolyl oligopeptidase family serine peptidase [Prevotellaceae bacterium]
MSTHLLLPALLLGALAWGRAAAQSKLNISKVRATPPVALSYPFMTDSANLKGEKFEAKALLTTAFLVNRKDFGEEIAADTSRYVLFPKAKEGGELRFFSFGVNADRYAKLKVAITSPGMLELYVNGKKELSKTTAEDSLQSAKKVEKEIAVNPGATEFSVKYLSLSSSKLPQEAVSVLVEAKDSAVTLTERGDRRPIRINDILEGEKVSGASISPNGRFVVLSYASVNEEGKSSRYSALYDTKTAKSLYIDKPMWWMPTSNKLYYTAQRGYSNALIGVDPATMSESVLAPSIPKDGDGFRIAPSEQFLIYSMKESFDERKGDLLNLQSPQDRQEGYFDRRYLYRYDLSTGVNRRLTYGKRSTALNDISRDSRYLLFSVSDEQITERPFRKSSLFMMNLETMQVDTLWTDEKYAGSAAFSPDGKKILIAGAPEAFGGVALNLPQGVMPNSYEGEAFIMSLPDRKVTEISKRFDPSISRMAWRSDDEIYLSVVEEDYENVYRYSVSKKTFAKLGLQEEVVRAFSPARSAAAAAYVGVSASSSTRAYAYDPKSGKSTLISDPSKERLEGIALGSVTDWHFTASDGALIKGRYYLPPNFDAAKKYPLVVYYYGGVTPTPRTLESSYPLHVYAALGYVVYTLQPSGTIGFGQEFSARHVNAWGKRTADDIIEGTKKFAAEHPFVNEKKIGCIGASYGGFMTMYLQTLTDIFSAAVSHAGISSIASYWGEGYWGYAYSATASAGSYPWNNPTLYVEQSPLFHADKIKTPLLLLHGMEDTNVPVGESIQMFTALKILGRPVELIQVKGENHGIAAYKRKIEWSHSIYAWFARWLQDDPAWWNSLYPEKK